MLTAFGGSGDSSVEPLLGPGATLVEAEAAFVDLEDRVTTLLGAKGDTLTFNLPDGDAIYTGAISGGPDAPVGSGDFTHYADLSLRTNFDTNNITGSATVTDVTGFENPTGSVDYTGSVTDDGGVAGITSVEREFWNRAIFRRTGIHSMLADKLSEAIQTP